jgi:hypothetical protein
MMEKSKIEIEENITYVKVDKKKNDINFTSFENRFNNQMIFPAKGYWSKRIIEKL